VNRFYTPIDGTSWPAVREPTRNAQVLGSIPSASSKFFKELRDRALLPQSPSYTHLTLPFWLIVAHRP
jgi:hypothetical protein